MMTDGAVARRIRRDVALTMAAIVIDKTGFNKDTYSEDLVPSKDPMDGFGASVSSWSYLLGKVEARLEAKNSDYTVFDVTDNFVRVSRGKTLRETNNEITKIILTKWIRLEEQINDDT